MNFKTGVAAFAVAISLALIGSSTYATDGQQTSKPKPKATVVTVKAGDTLSSIAKKYHTTYVKLFDANKSIANPDVIDVGDKVRIPTKNEKLPNRYGSYQNTAATSYQATAAAPTAVATAARAAAPAQAQAATYHASTAGNTYAWGNCTWYVKNRRPDLPNMLGNGGQWAANAAALGYATGYTPRAGAVAEQPGHVAYVESVNGNGTVNVSEMNWNGGLGQVHYRTVNASQFRYIY